MYALVNTMSSTERSFGHIISRHLSIEAAVTADRKYQEQVKRANGQTSYIPTVVVELPSKHAGSDASRSDCTKVSDDDYFDAQID